MSILPYRAVQHEWRGAIPVRENERAAQIVAFWRAIEVFAPQKVPDRTPPRSRRRPQSVVVDLQPDELAPWDDGHPLTEIPLADHLTWQFTVYGGLYEVSAVRAGLAAVFGDDDRPADGRRAEATAVFAFTLDAEGCIVENSATLSACAWAMNRLHSPGPNAPTWLDGFESHQREFTEALDRLAPRRPSETDNNSKNGNGAGRLDRIGAAVAHQVKAAAQEAVSAGAKATGTAVTTAVGAGLGAVAGPVVGGIAGAVAGKFAEKLLTPPTGANDASDDSGPAQPSLPRLHLTTANLHAFTSELTAALDPKGTLRARGVRVSCSQVPKASAGSADEQNFLNSYLADDLAKVEKDVRAGKHGAALATYLGDERAVDVTKRIDVRTRREPLFTGVQPNVVPGARWPTSTSRPLVVSQQFAVDRVLLELRDSAGIFAVNGPPGTGKTTMLRDVLAAILLDRARRLAVLKNPSDAYTEVVDKVQLGGRYVPAVRALKPELTGFEIVVATASNDAAANVTAELPSLSAVSGNAAAALGVGYFPDLASHLLGSPAWGLIAAVLGNMSYRSAFGSKFWWGGARERPDGSNEKHADDVTGLLGILQDVREAPPTAEDWDAAVTAFTDADAEVRRLSDLRQSAAQTLAEYHAQLSVTQEAEVACRRTDEARRRLSAELARATQLRTTAQSEFEEADGELEDWLKHKPGFFEQLFTWFRSLRDWQNKKSDLATERFAKRELRLSWEAETQRLEAAFHAAREDNARWNWRYQEATKALASLRGRIEQAQQLWPDSVPLGPAFAGEESFQLCAPWADPEFTEARNRLFLAALALHKAFLFQTEPLARGNLAVISAALRGKVRLSPRTALAAWQSLFLLVPMISTTFASLPRLFSGLGAESLGWLFVDEAGQAAPQQVVGGIWRCRRAVIVGDPQQLEPIVAMPLSAQQALQRHHGVHEQWLPDSTSAQGIADKHARHGTYLPTGDGSGAKVWVGAPLRVHRRCDRPMFEISNIIAYGGDLMIYGTRHPDDFPGTNAWLDVRSSQSDGNWVPAEGKALLTLLSQLLAAEVQPNGIRVISPFRDVVRGCRALVSRAFDEQIPLKNVGTVHTVQGQESDVVILVLGTPTSKVRARQWAAEKPNLLNVAVSRAKRRLYVIGNRDNWKDLRHFDVLAASLPTTTPEGLHLNLSR
ncbi:AAA domain-containing protein [Amycolatopsis carbonis]|uniref:AAA domain-containing protein n=1 Tax=Amycolatopsis carbonis TaxID=715471 RepID=A0A9Y2MYV9_9PSEU|nr:AAA domain-containing protein [Amycolatopsis sp. 2-15]WIX82013.1 AAA domain-containing protein [Amycolatopsis sp. 2-15]